MYINEHQNMPSKRRLWSYKDVPLEGRIDYHRALTRLSGPKSLASFPKRVALPTGRPKLMRYPHPWLCGATIAVPQAARYEVVHSRISVVGHRKRAFPLLRRTSTRTIRMRAGRVENTHGHSTRG